MTLKRSTAPPRRPLFILCFNFFLSFSPSVRYLEYVPSLSAI